jgi:hypothetical protein
LFLGVVATFVSAAVMEAKLKHQDLVNQENVATAKGAASWH